MPSIVSVPPDREGYYRGSPISQFVRPSNQSSSVALSFLLRAREYFEPSTKQWISWVGQDEVQNDRGEVVEVREVYVDTQLDVWIIGKKGDPNEDSIKRVCRALGWDGNIETFEAQDFSGTNCQWDVVADDYRPGKFKGNFLNQYDDPPGGQTRADAAKLREIAAKCGAGLRAVAANAVPPNRPSAPPPSRVLLKAADDIAKLPGCAADAIAPPPPSACDIPF